jgi:uncharacterized membrane protein
MSGYELIVFLHVLAAIVWVGAGVALQVLEVRAQRSGPERMRFFGQEAEWLSTRLFMPASFAAVAFGIWAVAIGSWKFSDAWITVGFAGFIATIVVGMGLIAPASKKLAQVVAERGPQDSEAQRLSRRMKLASRFNMLVLIAVVFDMVVKPGA